MGQNSTNTAAIADAGVSQVAAVLLSRQSQRSNYSMTTENDRYISMTVMIRIDILNKREQSGETATELPLALKLIHIRVH